jgi:hypothetical protein
MTDFGKLIAPEISQDDYVAMLLALSLCLFGEWPYHLSSFLPMRQPTVVTITVAIEYQVITKSGLSSVQYAA